MGLFGFLFKKERASSAVLIDVSADSIGGAYVYSKNGLPFLAFTKRVPIERRGDEPIETALSRSFSELGKSLLTEGAPALLRASGSAHLGNVIASIDAPWQETAIRSEKIEREKPFTFTKSVLDAAIAKGGETPPGKVLVDESVVGTVLDGYETKRPIGKRASRAAVTILTSFVNRELAEAVGSELRKLFHVSRIGHVAAPSIRYQAMRHLFSLEHDYLLVDMSADTLINALVRRGLLVAVEQTTLEGSSSPEIEHWLPALKKNLESITARYPLPRTFFLIAPKDITVPIKALLEGVALEHLRLSQEAPSVLPLALPLLNECVKLAGDVIPDLELMCMAIFWHRCGR